MDFKRPKMKGFEFSILRSRINNLINFISFLMEEIKRSKEIPVTMEFSYRPVHIKSPCNIDSKIQFIIELTLT